LCAVEPACRAVGEEGFTVGSSHGSRSDSKRVGIMLAVERSNDVLRGMDFLGTVGLGGTTVCSSKNCQAWCSALFPVITFCLFFFLGNSETFIE